MAASIYEIPVQNINGETITLEKWKGKVLLIVNVASQCGLTPQYEGLEAIYRRLKDRGLEVLGFPCNQFGSQEPGTESEIQSFCQTNYSISFPLFSKIDVNGASTHPLYALLKSASPGILGSESIKWNFTKFLVNRDGSSIKRFAPTDSPESIVKDIEALL